MICLAEDINDLAVLCADSPFGCQILSAARAYGLDRPFAQFWTDGHAAYSKLDGVMRICGAVYDPEEARAFLQAVGAECVICTPENAQAVGLSVTEQGVVLYKDLPETEHDAGGEVVSIRAVYDVLRSCDMVGDFEPFYLDLSHRVRHGTAFCAALYEKGEMAAATVALYGEKASLLTAVAVRPVYQRQGFGKQIVNQTEKKLGGRVYLLRAENENERFYASLGYLPCGAWCAGTL